MKISNRKYMKQNVRRICYHTITDMLHGKPTLNSALKSVKWKRQILLWSIPLKYKKCSFSQDQQHRFISTYLQNKKKQRNTRTYDITFIAALQLHTQLFEIEKSWNLNEISPAVSRSCMRSGLLLMIMSSSDIPGGRGWTWFSFGCLAKSTSGGKGIGVALKLELSAFGGKIGLSHRITWMRIGIFACLCKESFWLRETVS